MKRVLFLTGTRADFGKLKPLIQATQADPGFDCRVFATGMHLLARYGETVKEIHKAGIEQIHPFINQDASVTSQMDLVLATTVTGLGHYVREVRPDLLVIHGDRVETLAGAIVGSLNFILTAHIEGGEVSGTVDELLRHSISKLSHSHFVSNSEARKRLLQMGELSDSIFVIGSPEIDTMLSDHLPDIDSVRLRYDIRYEDFFILLLHPDVSEVANLPRHVEEIFSALDASGKSFVALFPNNDPGSEVIMRGLRARAEHPSYRVLPSMRFEHYLSLLRSARAIVGNSSSGVREAPVYGTPTVNIGDRQSNRFQHESIVDVPPRRAEILQAITKVDGKFPPTTHFGELGSTERFMGQLTGERLWTLPRQKHFQDT